MEIPGRRSWGPPKHDRFAYVSREPRRASELGHSRLAASPVVFRRQRGGGETSARECCCYGPRSFVRALFVRQRPCEVLVERWCLGIRKGDRAGGSWWLGVLRDGSLRCARKLRWLLVSFLRLWFFARFDVNICRSSCDKIRENRSWASRVESALNYDHVILFFDTSRNSLGRIW